MSESPRVFNHRRFMLWRYAVAVTTAAACRSRSRASNEPSIGTYRLVSVAGSPLPALDFGGPPKSIFVDSGRVEILANRRLRSVLAVRESTVDAPASRHVDVQEAPFDVTGSEIVFRARSGLETRMRVNGAELEYLSAMGRKFVYRLSRP